MAFESILDPVLGPLLALDPLWSILILSFGITFIITILYKLLTDQEEMKRLKKKMKESQKKIREVQKKDPEKAMKIQQEAMSTNMKYMKQSFKPTLYTIIPIIIIFGWMSANLAYHPIMTGQSFNVTVMMEEGVPGNITLSSVPELDIQEPMKKAGGEVTWTVAGDAGEYEIMAQYGERQYQKTILISDTRYTDPENSFDGTVQRIRVGMEEVHPLPFSIFGWDPGWLGTYIIFSIIISLSLRKAMGIA